MVLTSRSIFVKDPPVALTDSELVLNLGIRLNLKCFGESWLPVVTGDIVHGLWEPLWARKGASNEQRRLDLVGFADDSDGDFRVGHSGRGSTWQRGSSAAHEQGPRRRSRCRCRCRWDCAARGSGCWEAGDPVSVKPDDRSNLCCC